jgi:hypothetical protein
LWIGGSGVLLLLTAVIAWPIGAWRGWRGRRARANRAATGQDPSSADVRQGPGGAREEQGFSGAPGAARLVLWSAAVLLVAFVVTPAVVFVDPIELVFGIPRALRVALALPIAAAVLTAVSLAFAVRSWWRADWPLPGRIHYTLVTLSAAVLLGMLWYWKLLGYHLR